MPDRAEVSDVKLSNTKDADVRASQGKSVAGHALAGNQADRLIFIAIATARMHRVTTAHIDHADDSHADPTY